MNPPSDGSLSFAPALSSSLAPIDANGLPSETSIGSSSSSSSGSGAAFLPNPNARVARLAPRDSRPRSDTARADAGGFAPARRPAVGATAARGTTVEANGILAVRVALFGLCSTRDDVVTARCDRRVKNSTDKVSCHAREGSLVGRFRFYETGKAWLSGVF